MLAMTMLECSGHLQGCCGHVHSTNCTQLTLRVRGLFKLLTPSMSRDVLSLS